MTQSLSWNLHGNDQLSGVLEKLDRTVSQLARRMDSASADAREYGRAMSTAETSAVKFQGSVSKTGSHLDGFSQKLVAVAGMLRTVAVTSAVALGAAVTAAGSFGIKMAAANEEAAISFELMLGSAEKAKSFLQDLQKFAAATPFEMPQLRSAASRLLAVGTSAERIIPLLTVLGDATAGMGTGAEGIQRAVTALTQMQQKGKVTGEEMMQLTEAGIPAWETLAAKLGVDVAEAMEKVTKREVDAGVIFDAVMQKQGAGLQRLTGMMQKQSLTMTGLWSTFKDNAGQALAKFTEPAIPGIKKMMEFAAEAIPAVLTKIQDMARQVRSIFEGSDVPERIMNSLKELRDKVLPKLSEAWDRIVEAVLDNKEGLEKFGRFISDIIIPAIGVALPVAIDLVTQTIETWIFALAKVVDAIKFMVNLWLSQMHLILVGAEKAFGWVPVLGDKLRTALADFDNFANGVLNKLNALDGKTVDVYINYREYRSGERGDTYVPTGPTYYGGHPLEFAGGGTVPGPMGAPMMALVHGGELVLTPEQQRTSSNDILGLLRVVHETPGGQVIREELLALKRTGGLASLGLA